MMANKHVLYYAHGAGGEWEAICVDFDIAVQGRSCDEAIALLHEAVRSYVDLAYKEDPATARQLLGRRTPWHVRTHLWFAYHASRLLRRLDGQTVKVGAELPCPA